MERQLTLFEYQENRVEISSEFELSEGQTFEQCEKDIELSNHLEELAYYVKGQRLGIIEKNKWYKKVGYDSWDVYCRERWNLSGTHGHKLIQSAEVIENIKKLSFMNHSLPTTQRQTWPLINLEPKQQAEAWDEAIKTAPTGGVPGVSVTQEKKMSGRHVQETVDRLYPKESKIDPFPFERDNQELDVDPFEFRQQQEVFNHISSKPQLNKNYYTISEWDNLSPENRRRLLQLNGNKTFNKQDNDNIEWARWSWNPITGCLHNCAYCLDGDTLILMSDGTTKPIKDIQIGDKIIGTRLDGQYHYLTETTVLDHWQTYKEAYEITLSNGVKLVCSGDHRWLTNRGWKYTTGKTSGPDQRPYLTENNQIIGIGRLFSVDKNWETESYQRVFNPAIKRKFVLEGRAIKNSSPQIVSIKPLNTTIPMYDISTGTEDFIANGVVSHNCYARDIANRFYPQKFEPVLIPERLSAPANTKQPDFSHFPNSVDKMGWQNVFVCSMADLFGKWVPAEWIELVLEQVRNNPQWTFLFLTKFPIRMSEFEYPENVWLGTSVDNQYAVERAEKAFRKIDNVRVKWLSCEPMMERLTFTSLDMFDWVVIGGASRSTQTPEFRPPREWVNHLESQAKVAGCNIYEKTNLLERIREYPRSSSYK